VGNHFPAIGILKPVLQGEIVERAYTFQLCALTACGNKPMSLRCGRFPHYANQNGHFALQNERVFEEKRAAASKKL
jgi:hypothetical protein